MNASQRRVDAAVLIGVNCDDQELQAALGARRIRKLIVLARFSANPNTISICCDDRATMLDLTDHVIRRGYSCPLFVVGSQTQSAHLMCKETFLTRWQDLTDQTSPSVTVDSCDPKRAYQVVAAYLRQRDVAQRPDVMVCENNTLAMVAIDAIHHEFVLRTPEDMAVTGFDDVPQASSLNYCLTSFRQPLSAMIEGLVNVLKGDADTASQGSFAGHLVVRD